MNKKQWNKVKEPNPMPQSSKSTRLGQSHPAVLKWSTSEKAGRQHPAQRWQPPGGIRHRTRRYWMKTQNWENISVVCLQRFRQPVQSMIIACFARIYYHSVFCGCINSTHCQWWSSLFWIGQLAQCKNESLSKTTKLLLLDSLLQEVCIEYRVWLVLSSLGLSVCLVSHNLPIFVMKHSQLNR